jgi:hypothetical protein
LIFQQANQQREVLMTVQSGEAEDDDNDPLAHLIRDLIDSRTFLNLAELSKMQAGIDAFLPKFEDFSPIVQAVAAMPKSGELSGIAATLAALPTPEELSPLAAVIAAMPKPGEMTDLQTGLTSLQKILKSSIPMTDFSELSGLQRIAQGLAPKIDLTILESFSRLAEKSLPAFIFTQAPEPTIEEVLEWAVSIDLDEETPEDTPEIADPLERLRRHLGLLATWIFDEATRFHAGAIHFDQMVDNTNTQLGRYQQLAANFFFLYGIVVFLQHMI